MEVNRTNCYDKNIMEPFALSTIAKSFDENYANQVFEELNDYRVKNGKSKLLKYPLLINAAETRGLEITHTWGHIRPDGSSIYSVIQGESIFVSGENLAMGQTNPSMVMAAWKNSSGHNANMLDESHQFIGISCFRAKVGNSYYNYWVQLFGIKSRM